MNRSPGEDKSINAISGRILALDYGKVRIGAAISDPLGITASSLGCIKIEGKEDALKKIVELVAQRQPSVVVMGIPVDMDGKTGIAAKKARKFARELGENIAVPLETIDERLTTAEAQKLLLSADVSRRRRKEVVDGMAASLILQKYLESRSNHENT